jgi:membrane-associated protease RseP (regulator of RpoE activity)
LGGEATYGMAGMALYDVDGKTEVIYVMPQSAAADAGVQLGDILLSVNGKKMADSRAAVKSLTDYEPGSLVYLELRRGDKTISRFVDLRKRPFEPMESALQKETHEKFFPLLFGLDLEYLKPVFGGKEYRVLRVLPGSVADESGISDDDSLDLNEWRYLKNQKAVSIQVTVKRRKSGYLESTMQLAAPISYNALF